MQMRVRRAPVSGGKYQEDVFDTNNPERTRSRWSEPFEKLPFDHPRLLQVGGYFTFAGVTYTVLSLSSPVLDEGKSYRRECSDDRYVVQVLNFGLAPDGVVVYSVRYGPNPGDIYRRITESDLIRFLTEKVSLEEMGYERNT